MIRRFTSAQFVPANAGAKAKNPVGSTLFSKRMVALLRHPGHKILRTSCHESARKRLMINLFSPSCPVRRSTFSTWAVMDMGRTPAVVVGGDACARSLGRDGVPVVVIDSDAKRPGMHSRYGRPFVASGMSGPDLVDSLLALRARLDSRPLLFLTSDAQVRTVSEHRSRLEDAFRIALPDHRCVCELLHKSGFQRIAETHGFPVPRAVTIREEKDLARLGEIRFPAVIKPGTKEAFLSNRAPRANRVCGPEEAEAVCRSLLPAAPDLIIQEWIEGAESDIYFCLQYRAASGATVSSFVGRKLRCWPLQTGSTASCMPAPEVAGTIEPLTTAFFDRARFVGMCSMEFKRDRRTGAFLMIEPTVGRADWQEEVATLNGINIPLAAYRHELGLPATTSESPSGNLIWRDPPCYWRSVIAARSFRDKTPPAATVRSSSWRANDPVPLAFFWLEWAKIAWRPSRWRN
jgi:D-aspartate ligase